MPKKIRLDLKEIDYKNLNLLSGYLTENGKIVSSTVSHLDTRSQKAVSREIKRARQMALLPYADYKHGDVKSALSLGIAMESE